MHKLDAETIEKINDYKKDNIIFQMQMWKNKIDNTLSTDELNLLNELRAKAKHFKTELKVKREIQKNDFENMSKKERRNYKKNIHKSMKSELKNFKNEINDDLKNIMKNNLELTEEIISFAKENGKKWKEDIKQIIKENYSDESLNKKRKHNKRENYKKNKYMSDDNRDKKLVAQIYLFDGTDESEYFLKENQIINDNSFKEAKIVPNPFSSITNIEFELSQEEFVIVSIYNNTGDLVSVINNKKLPSGKHSIEFDANKYNLSNGNYIYKIESLSINMSGNITLIK